MLETRASRAIVLVPQQGQILVFNFLAKSAFTCNHEVIRVLTLLEDWRSEADIAEKLPEVSRHSIRRELDKLIQLHALVARGDPYAEIEEEYLRSWEWGIPSALLHFALRDNPCLTGEEAVRRQLSRAVHDPSPRLFFTHDRQALRLAGSTSVSPLLSLMARRRTNRVPGAASIGLDQLADCLHAGLGIVGEVMSETGPLPLAMTPSGGARNPYEAYVYARAVKGLAPGFYHYAAAQHSLARVNGDDLPEPSLLLGGQEWTDAMPCVIFLIAHFERTMWKYSDANGYRVVLIEAGHIGQNIMLAATAHGLSACPTAALCHSPIHHCLGITGPTRSAVYALTLSAPGDDRSVVLPIERKHPSIASDS